MKLQRTLICIAGVFFAVGFAASQAAAGTGTSGCNIGSDTPAVIEVNSLRAGGKTIVTSPNDTTNTTAKARIAKGTAAPGTTLLVTLTLQAITDELQCVPRTAPICIPDYVNPPGGPAQCDSGDPTCLCHAKVDDPDPDCLSHAEELVDVVIGEDSRDNITLGVGKGGKGATLPLSTEVCGPSGFITFAAEFRGPDPEGEDCIGTKTLRKACK